MLLAMTLLLLAALFAYRNRAPLALTLGLFTIMPVHSVMCHWFENEQRGHWFGYWFGHDMFTPPFGIYPEMSRNAILFGGTDPGRFAPTYMIFDESFTPANCKPMDPKFDRRDVYIITQNALADGTYLNYIRAHYDRSSQNELHLDTPFFKEAVLNTVGAALGKDSGLVKGLANTAYNLLDVPVTKFGAKIEARRRAEGVYPPKEIYTPTPDDSQNSFSEYMQDAQQRMANNQLRPGEGVHMENGRVSVSGNVAVMMINGLLCKVIFDHNPTNDFYVEESFPLEWMYPYETPSGVIMKINRQPLSSLPEDVFKKDHEFWSKYSERLVGNWITYDTTVKEIADFSDRVYLRHNFKGFIGDHKFVRDDDAQKAFSKLRSSIGGMFYWRISPQCPPEYRPKNEAEQQALIRETDFALKQSFAFCPYSPEAVYRYVNFLLQYGRLDDAALVAQTCYKLDPYNDQIKGLVDQMEKFKNDAVERTKAQGQIQEMETEAQKNPTNFQNIFRLASYYLQMQQTNRVVTLFDGVVANPKVTPAEIGAVAQFYVQINNLSKLEATLEKYTAVLPDQPEPRYDLAALQAMTGKTDESLKNLRLVLDLSAARLKTNSAARDLMAEARKDWRFNTLRSSAEFQKLVPPN
jgi:thioredoxin-like negative regulator of GroEL